MSKETKKNEVITVEFESVFTEPKEFIFKLDVEMLSAVEELCKKEIVFLCSSNKNAKDMLNIARTIFELEDVNSIAVEQVGIARMGLHNTIKPLKKGKLYIGYQNPFSPDMIQIKGERALHVTTSFLKYLKEKENV
jgi:hypothetical protein